uniref:Uncharacterized protein n=1 Tax=viral metagenome TaxID=1070528 RepID=A0A6M3LQV7_9ZZZZ
MPIPTPKKDEKRDDFMSRCMGDSVMNKEFKDNKQRYAVCVRQWEEKGGDTTKHNK